MAQIWKEEREGHWSEHFDFHGYLGLPPVDISPDPKLVPVYTYFVRVCGFTFRFGSVAQIVSVLEYYQQKVVPSTRRDTTDRAFERDISQRWYERLPGQLRNESNRHKVVKALTLALEEFAEY
ncbi:MAG: hypothetical protein AAGI37_06125, partial [Planctomycetota bacterium]